MTRDLEDRLRRIEDKQEIADLVALYGFVMDERDLVGLPTLFTDDARLGSADGVFDAHGLAAIEEAYAGRFAVLGATNHFVHSSISRFEDDDPARRTAWSAVTREVVRNGETLVVALRYHDVYQRTARGWRISERVMSYMYYLPVDAYAATLPTADRSLVYGEPRPADWPAVLVGGDLDWLRAHYDQAT